MTETKEVSELRQTTAHLGRSWQKWRLSQITGLQESREKWRFGVFRCDLRQKSFLPNEKSWAHQFGRPLRPLLSRHVSYKPRVCWSAWGLESFMSLSVLSTPQLIFLKVSCFCKLRGEKFVDWVTAARHHGADEVWFNVSLQREMIAILNSNTPQPE